LERPTTFNDHFWSDGLLNTCTFQQFLMSLSLENWWRPNSRVANVGGGPHGNLDWTLDDVGHTRIEVSKVNGYIASSSQRCLTVTRTDMPYRITPVTSQRWHFRLYPSLFWLKLDLTTPEGWKVEFTKLAGNIPRWYIPARKRPSLPVTTGPDLLIVTSMMRPKRLPVRQTTKQYRWESWGGGQGGNGGTALQSEVCPHSPPQTKFLASVTGHME